MGIRTDHISKLLIVVDENGLRRNPTTRIKRKFQAKLEEYQKVVVDERKRRRRQNK